MGVRISGIEPGSKAEKAKIEAGDILESINGHEICDVLDYRFYLIDNCLKMIIKTQAGELKKLTMRKQEYEETGLLFESYLMDQKHSCRNKCIFCFIDQLPKGMRESLYFKDDDARLSFLMGNYITLTNLTEHEAERIISMHISPVNISVHTTNPDLRVAMMHNSHAGESLGLLRRFAQAGIRINCQIVLCRAVNDGAELERSLNDLGSLYPSVESIAVVPVGLTKYREGLAELLPFDRQTASKVVDQVEAFGDRFLEEHGRRIVYPADEFYLKAGRLIPDAAFYDEFNQLENGVGLTALLVSEFQSALQNEDFVGPVEKRKISLATGTSIAPTIRNLVGLLEQKVPGFDCEVYAIENYFFGKNVNVSGLVTAGDIIKQLKDKDLGEELLIPAVMLRRERDLFLDDLTIEDLSKALHIKVTAVENDGYELMEKMLGMQE